jgi:hypothetical protein
MKRALFTLVNLVFIFNLIDPSLALSDYLRGVQDSLNRGWSMAQRYDQAKAKPYYISKSFTPIHSIDSSWNQSNSIQPVPDASGMINGYPAEIYYSIGPALTDF